RGGPVTPSVLCVHAHPDDEAIWTGGTLARYADEGARTAVVTCTWAAGPRMAELRTSLEILGAGEPRPLGYADARDPDSAPGRPRFLDVPFDEAVGRVVEHIREFRPDVVLTYDGYGGSGHADHGHAHRVTPAAGEAAGDDPPRPGPGGPGRPGAADRAAGPRTALASRWAAVFAAPPDPGQTLPGVSDEQITTHLDVGPWAERKWAAILAHETEVARGGSVTMLTSLPEQARAQLLGNEWYRRIGYT